MERPTHTHMTTEQAINGLYPNAAADGHDVFLQELHM
jgi:hypothetical protein